MNISLYCFAGSYGSCIIFWPSLIPRWPGCWDSALEFFKEGTLGFSLGLCWCGYGWSHRFFLWCLAGREQLLSKKFSVLLNFTFTCFLTHESRFLLELFVFFCALCSWLLSLTQKSGIFEVKRKPRDHSLVILWSQSP